MTPAIALLCLTAIHPRPRADLSHFRAFAESTAAQESWSGTGAIMGAVGGGLAFAGAFYHFSHRDGAPNSLTGNAGGAIVGSAFGAAGGALFGAFVGSLIPKHKKHG